MKKIIAASALLMAIIMAFCSCKEVTDVIEGIGADVIDAKEFITIDFGDYDGYGRPSFDVNYDSLQNKLDEEKVIKFTEGLSESLRNLIRHEHGVEYVFEFDFDKKYENISNGDKIVINITLNSEFVEAGFNTEQVAKECGIRFKETTLEFTASGLSEEKVLDVFLPDMEQYINYIGANGCGKLDILAPVTIPSEISVKKDNFYFVGNRNGYEINIVYNNTIVANVSYKFDYTSYQRKDLTAGDKIKLTAEVRGNYDYMDDNRNVLVDGYTILLTNTKEIIVPDLGVFITSPSELTSDVIAELKNMAYEHEREEIHKIYMATYKPGVPCENYKCTSFAVLISSKSGFLYENDYFIDCLYDITLTKDGDISVTADWYNNSIYGCESVDEVLTYLDYESYDFVIVE